MQQLTMTTPIGMSMQAAYRSIPVKAFITEAPPNRSMAVTMMLVIMAKTKKTLCAVPPQRARMISSRV
jgi:hypothetical protein